MPKFNGNQVVRAVEVAVWAVIPRERAMPARAVQHLNWMVQELTVHFWIPIRRRG